MMKNYFGLDISFLVKSGFWAYVERVVRVGAEAGIAVVLARTVSREVFGEYQFLIAIFMALGVLTMRGFNGMLLRALSKAFDGTYMAVVRLSFRWSIPSVVLLFLVGLWWYVFRDVIVGSSLMISVVVFPFVHVLQRWEVLLHAKERFAQRAKYGGMMSVGLFVGVCLVLLLGYRVVLPIFLVYVALHAVFNTVYHRRVLRLLENDRVEPMWRKSGYKLMPSSLFEVMYTHFDKVILVFFLGMEMLAVYSVAIVIVEAFKYTLGNVMRVYVPRLFRSDTEYALRWLRMQGWKIGLGSLMLVVVLWFIMPFLIPVLFSDMYSESVLYAQLYLFIIPFYVFAFIYGQILIKERYEGLYVRSLVMAGAVNILLYVLLIPWVGIAGAVFGSVGYYIVMVLMRYVGLMRLRRRALS